MTDRVAAMADLAPGAVPVLGHIPGLATRPLEFLRSVATHGDLVGIRVGRERWWVVCDPALTHQVLADGRTFDKGGPFYEQARRVIGDSVASCPHENHRSQRRLLQPSFGHERLAGYAEVMSGQIAEVLGRWRGEETIDVLAQMNQITAQVTTRTLFGTSVDAEEAAIICRDVNNMVEGVFWGMLTPKSLGRVSPPARRLSRTLSSLNNRVSDILAGRSGTADDHGDMLSALLAAYGDDANGQEIRENIIVFILAGTETTATALAWALHLLATHPGIRAELQEEVDTVLAGRPIATHDDLSELKLTRRVLTEALRLYPPTWMITRKVTADTTLAGHRLPAGSTVLVSPYVMHHRAESFPDPCRFDPDRWLPDLPMPPRGAFLPFGGGARVCIGDRFGMMEAILALASITARWRLESLPGDAVRPLPRATLRPHPLRMRLHRRQTAA